METSNCPRCLQLFVSEGLQFKCSESPQCNTDNNKGSHIKLCHDATCKLQKFPKALKPEMQRVMWTFETLLEILTHNLYLPMKTNWR